MRRNDVDDRASVVAFAGTVSHVGPRTVVAAVGRLGPHTAGSFRNQLLNAAKEHPAAIVVDLAGVTGVDERCVAVLVEAWHFATEHGIELLVAAPCTAIRDAFEIAPSGRLLTVRR